ncbi:VanW family protein [Deinococcus sp. YIM 134068]|uniref:VanW family protein n=1 Tax=Deinococcus lichenicola TaxID=3118910 RepID=UPI002F9456F2
MKRSWVVGLSSAVVLGGALALGVAVGDRGHLAPGLSVAGVEVGGLTREEALAALTEKTTPPQVTVEAGGRTWTVGADMLGWRADKGASVDAALKATAERGFVERVRGFIGQASERNFPLAARVDAEQAKKALSTLTQSVNTPPRDATAVFDKATLRYVLRPDAPGRRARVEEAANALAADPSLTTLTLPVTTWKARYTAETVRAHVERGNRLMRPLTVRLAGTDEVAELTALQVANLYWVRGEGIVLDEPVVSAVLKRFAAEMGRPARNARYAARGNSLVGVAEAAGYVVDRKAALAALRKAIADPAARAVVFPGKVSRPTLTLAELPDPKEMELIASGRSTYYGSDWARRANIAAAAAKISGVVVPAGENFSFLDALGRITPGNGFVGGLIISGGRTVDGLGGGVCQVSTTAFRALYAAGLPVVERHGHSYRVRYYEPQVGFEAAVYDPGVDLKLRNDTGAPLYLMAVNDDARSTLEVQVWGKLPGRTVTVSPAVISSRTPHPPAEYVANSSMRPGASRQVDWAQDGYKLSITRTIKDAQGVRRDTVKTVYKPWRAVYEYGPRN